MVVKGSIGETCTVEAKIVGIRVLEEGTFYDLVKRAKEGDHE